MPSGRVAQLTFKGILCISRPFIAESAVIACSWESYVTKQYGAWSGWPYIFLNKKPQIITVPNNQKVQNFIYLVCYHFYVSHISDDFEEFSQDKFTRALVQISNITEI